MASARQIRDEIMKMTIVVNSDPAQKAIYDLSKKNQELKEKNDALGASMKEVRSTLGKNSDEYKKLTSELNQNKTAIIANEREMERLRGEMDISQMTMSQLRKEAALLRTNLGNMVPGSEASQRLQTQLEAVNNRMNEVRNGAAKTSLSFRDLADKFNHYQGIALAATAVLVGFGVTIQNIIDRNNKMADAMSGVEKTTGMARKEVEELTRSFSDFDTRTKKVDLLKIAEVGGRLGVAKEDIKAFTQEVDKANVALGDGFEGGVEQVTNTLGKLQGLYRETKDLNISTAINQIGSAMNELGAAGAASEANIGDFALRLGSLPDKLKPTIAESLALGAAFEESGIMAERSATAYASFIRSAAKDTGKFAEVMKISKQEVEALMNTDPLEFFLKFAEGAKGMDTTELAKMLDYLKLNDQYVISSLGAASENTDRFRKSIELSNKSLTEATSLQEEFNKVNNNAAAIYEKVQRKMAELLTSKGIADFINGTVTAFGKFLGVVEDAEGYITGFRTGLVFLTKIIAILIATTLSYNLVTGVYNGLLTTSIQRVAGLTIVEKARNAVMLIGNGIQTVYRAGLWLLAAGYSLLTGNVAGATFAMRGFTAAIAANPLGAILVVLTAVASAYFLLSKNTKQAETSQQALNRVMKEGTENAAQQTASLEVLYKTATNVNLSTEERLKAVRKLKAEFPGYFKDISDEIIMNGKAADSYHALKAAIVASARAEAGKAELVKREGERFKESDDWKKRYGEELNLLKLYKKELADFDKSGSANGYRRITLLTAVEQKEKALRQLEIDRYNWNKKNQQNDTSIIKAISANEERSARLNMTDSTVDPVSGYSTPEKADKPKSAIDTKREEDRKKREQEAYDRMIADWKAKNEDAAQIARQLQLDIEDAKIEAMEEGYDKQIDALNLQEMRKMAEIEKRKVGQSDFDKLEIARNKAKADDKYIFDALKQSWIKNNEELENLKLGQQEIFNNKRLELRYKSEQKFLSEQENAHQTALGRLKREHNEELATYSTLEELKEGLKGRMDEKERTRITTWAQGKEALNKIYQKRELELQVAHLEAMVKLYEGLDLGVLTPEQREAVMKFIEEAGNKIAEFRAKIKGEEQNDKGPKKISQKGSTDVLGMAADDWDTMFTNIQNGTDMLGTMVAAVGALHNAFGAYYQYVEANEKRQLQTMERNTDRKKKNLKSQLDSGLINQETYKKLTIKADNDLEKRKAEIAMKQAKREKQMAIASTLINTAQAIMGIWAQVPKFDFGATAAILSGVVGALGAIQIATIMSQPLPTAEGYEDGFGMEYPIERQQDGKRFNVRRSRLRSGLVDRPTHFIAGENNKLEMVIDNPTWTTYSPQLKSAIHSANARAKGFETGFNTNAGNTTTSSGNDEIMIKMMSVLAENTQVMREIKETGITAVISKTARNGKEIDEMRQEYLDLKNKNKH